MIMDIKCEIKTEDEPLEEVNYNRGVHEQILRFQEIQDESCDTIVDIESEKDIKEEPVDAMMVDSKEKRPLDIKIKNSMNDEIFKLKSEITEKQNLIFEGDHKGKADIFYGKRSSGSDPQPLREDKGTEMDDRKEFKGSDCDLTFESEKKLMSYLESPCKGKFKCVRSICYCNFESGSKTETPSLRHQDQSILKTKLFKCSECDYKCKRKSFLIAHSLRHQKLFKCPNCDYESNQKGNVKRHMLSHQNIKLLKCSECSYECYQKLNLQIHMLKHQNIKLLICSVCDYESNRKANLKRHLLTQVVH